jgi:hypothetical protein
MYLRGVFLHSRYAADLDYFRRHYPAMNDVQRHIEDAISENPRIGEPQWFSPDIFVYITTPVGSTPGFVISYDFDENNITLNTIELYDKVATRR